MTVFEMEREHFCAPFVRSVVKKGAGTLSKYKYMIEIQHMWHVKAKVILTVNW
jgi:hypothetical protein